MHQKNSVFFLVITSPLYFHAFFFSSYLSPLYPIENISRYTILEITPNKKPFLSINPRFLTNF